MKKNKVDVLFINPGDREAVYQALGKTFSAIEPPSLVGFFANYIRKKGLSTQIIDAPALNISPRQVAELVRESFDPVLIVMVIYGFQPSASTQNMPAAGETCRYLKEINPSYRIMMTGTHPAALPGRTLREEPIDFVCDREGPETIYETCLAIKSTGSSLNKIPSLWYKAPTGMILSNPAAPLMDNLDEELPGVAWDLLPMDKYRAHNWHCFEHIHERQPYASLHTSLGCPYKCTFCCINAPFGKPSYRMWSPDAVIREIDILVNQSGLKTIKSVD